MKRIVLTGGPGAGKTIISSAIAAGDARRYCRVPEAATQVYNVLHTRWDLLDAAGRRAVQRRIYQLQREQEEALARASPAKTLLLDRGTVDGAAYWPDGPDDYWRALGTTAGAELARYDAVIWMQTGAALGVYDRNASNPVRFESPDVAIASGDALRALWGAHPRLYAVDAYPTLAEKLAAVRRVIEGVRGGNE